MVNGQDRRRRAALAHGHFFGRERTHSIGGGASPPSEYRGTMAKKQSGSKVSSLASKVLSGAKKPTTTDAKTLAASALSQDEKGKPKPKR